MCGIFAYVGKDKCKETIVEGLLRLEYRGYDSVGVAFINAENNKIDYCKEVGSVSDLKSHINDKNIDGSTGIGHTRWATHGIASPENSHPHFNCDRNIALVHNGIIENYAELKNELINSGHKFHSDTDSEVVAHLLETILKKKKNVKDSIVELVKHLDGFFSLVFILKDNPDSLVIVRKKSPLAIGIGKDEMYVSSDSISFLDKTKQVVFLPDETFVLLKKDSIITYNFSGERLELKPKKVDFEFSAATKQGFEHFMLKEIYEQKDSINRTISFYKAIGNQTNLLKEEKDKSSFYQIETEYNDTIWDQLGLSSEKIKSLKHISLVGAGTSWHAGRIAQFYFEEICGIPTSSYLSSEFRYKKFFPQEDSIAITISQSGETADTLECLRLMNDSRIPTVALTNSASSTMVREANGFLLMQAGPEISVASTKAFTAQVASLFWLANRIALERGAISAKRMRKAEEDLFISSEILETVIENYKWEILQRIAPKYSKYKNFIFLGRHIGYPFSMEAALKLKEISYLFSIAYPAGELKHGPLALVDQETPVFFFSSVDDLIYKKILSNAKEVKARNGHIVSFVFDEQKELMDISDEYFVIPKVRSLLEPIAMSGLMQFLVYCISKELNNSIDKPRNLAKSVTVE